MAKIIRKSIPWFLILALIVFAISIGFNFKSSEIKADSTATPGTSVTVGNDAPAFTTDPYEDPSSHSGTGTGGTAGNPTNMGEDVIFKAEVSDGNGDDVYLAICKGAGITAGAGGIAPTCTGGEWVIGTAKAVGVITETYTITASESAQSYDWYGYVCDNNSGTAECSGEAHAAEPTGPPFYVNHNPTFTEVTDDGSGDPGASDFTVTAATTIDGTDGFGDGDTNAAQDTVSLYVCKSAEFTGGTSPSCTGGQWCNAAGVAPGSTLTCNLTPGIPDPAPHGTDVQDYWPYVVDNHGLVGTGVKQGSAEHYSVNDIVPTISGTPELNAAGLIDLTGAELSTKDIYVTGVVTDDNDCNDIVAANVTADVWQTSLTHGGCDIVGEANGNNCYPDVTCALDGVDTCEASGDKTASYQCTVSFQYYANPTDANTPWVGDDWTATLIPGDGQGEATGVNTVAQELQSFLALDLTSGKDSIGYGSVAAGGKSGSEGVEISVETEIRATGNCGLDHKLYGADMELSGDGETIVVGNQRYKASVASAQAWDDGTVLTIEGGAPAKVDLECCKSGYTGTPEVKSTWWGITIDVGQASGEYTGTNTIEAVKDDWASPDDWCEAP